MIAFFTGVLAGILFVIACLAVSVYWRASRLAQSTRPAPPLDKAHASESAVAILRTGAEARRVPNLPQE